MNWPTITKDTPIDKVFEIHRMIWNDVLELYHATGSLYDDLGYLNKPSTPYIYNCALCDYVFWCSPNRRVDCENCPANWGSDEGCQQYDGLYKRLLYFDPKRGETITSLIEAIRDIKPKEELINGECKHAEGSGRVSE